MFRRAAPFFVAYDLPWVDGRDLRGEPLIERKRLLRRVVARGLGALRYLDHVVGRGRDLFALVCAADLEGIVLKWTRGTYSSAPETSTWVKVKNRDYTQARDRWELLDRRAP